MQRFPCVPSSITENVGTASPFHESSNTMLRRRVKQTESFEIRLSAEAARLREQAKKLPHGIEREELLRRARQAETAAHMNEWLASPGLQPPRDLVR
jgi:hypothetical protein